MTASLSELAAAVALLEREAPELYRVLRRFEPRERYRDVPTLGLTNVVEPPPLSNGLIVDLEATSLDVQTAHIIEIALVPFTFTHDGFVADVGEPYGSYRYPGMPIPPEITALTGITDAMVRDETWDLSRIRELLEGAGLLIAHNAGYDRPILERHFGVCSVKHWACSRNDVPWALSGSRSTVLEYLLYKHCGEFHEGHRAVEDALAALHVLATAQLDGRPAFAHLLDAARKTQVRVWAEGSPFSYKEILKDRGYSWADKDRHPPKGCWYKDVTEEEARTESAWLSTHALVHSPTLKRISAKDRYSKRAG